MNLHDGAFLTCLIIANVWFAQGTLIGFIIGAICLIITRFIPKGDL